MTNPNQPPNESAIDFPELLSRVDNDRELLLDLMSIFKEEFPRHVRELTDVIAARDLKKMAVVSHTLKGMLANLAVSRAARPPPENSNNLAATTQPGPKSPTRSTPSSARSTDFSPKWRLTWPRCNVENSHRR